jgi:hypothetical protein
MKDRQVLEASQQSILLGGKEEEKKADGAVANCVGIC